MNQGGCFPAGEDSTDLDRFMVGYAFGELLD